MEQQNEIQDEEKEIDVTEIIERIERLERKTKELSDNITELADFLADEQADNE